MAAKGKKKAVTPTTRLGRTLQWIRDTFTGLVDWVKTTRPYQYLDAQWIDAPPVKATTLLGYCLALGLGLTVMFSASMLLIRKHDAKAMGAQYERALKGGARELADSRDQQASCLIELDRVNNELAGLNTTPKLLELTPSPVKPRGKRSSFTRGKAGEGYSGPRVW